MITEDYVSFETAKLLKEKGFDDSLVPVNYGFNTYATTGILIMNNPTNSILAPTLQMAMKWLREVHRLFIFISPWAMRENNNIQYYFEIREIKTCDFETLYDYTTKELDSFEKTADAAILYCLQNLI